MKVILKETISSLGIIGSECDVAPGYARNYLFPQGKAVQATDRQRKLMEQERTKLELQIAKEKKLAEEMAEKVKGVECTVKRKVVEETKLYGSVSVKDVRDALENVGVHVDKRSILLVEPIKEVGEYKIPVRLYKDVEPEINLKVEAEEK